MFFHAWKGGEGWGRVGKGGEGEKGWKGEGNKVGGRELSGVEGGRFMIK